MRSIPVASPALAAGLAAMVLITAPASAAPRLFSTEPELGTLRVGQRVLVDDGVCKAGEIREVVVNSRQLGDTKSYPDGGPRVRRCIKR